MREGEKVRSSLNFKIIPFFLSIHSRGLSFWDVIFQDFFLRWVFEDVNFRIIVLEFFKDDTFGNGKTS